MCYLSHHTARGHHYFDEVSNDGAEFLGYFCPANEMCRIDE